MPFTTKKIIPNICVQKNIEKCSFSKEKFVDPVIVEEDGMTYEHNVLVNLIKNTLCKYKKINLLGGSYNSITYHQNKIMWKDEFSDRRIKPQIIQKKEYKGYQSSLAVETMHQNVKISPEEFISKRTESKFFGGVIFKSSGCLKQGKFVNFIIAFFHVVCVVNLKIVVLMVVFLFRP